MKNHNNGGRGHYKVDGYHSRPQLPIVFEYHGCHVHGCKECFPNRDDKDAYDNKTHEENYQNTLRKKIFCEEHGYKYIEMWDCQWKKIISNPALLEKYVDELKNITTI